MEGGEESEERREEGGGGEKDRTYWPWREVRKVRKEEKREEEGRRTDHIGHGGRPFKWGQEGEENITVTMVMLLFLPFS